MYRGKKLNGFWMNEFERMFDLYAELIRKEIEKESELGIKLPKIQSLILILHATCRHRFSKEYLEKSKDFSDKLGGMALSNIKYQPNEIYSFWEILMQWFALMVEERYALVSNLNRVDFGR